MMKTDNVPATTATTASTEPAPSLTLDMLLEVRRKLQAELPVIYYFASEHVENKTAVYKLPNDQARAGYDLAFHPDMLPSVAAELAGRCILRPMDNAEEKRRADLTADMMRIGANWLAAQPIR